MVMRMKRLVDADKLWDLLLDQRDQNTAQNLPWQVNTGINQAIAILNAMEPEPQIVEVKGDA